MNTKLHRGGRTPIAAIVIAAVVLAGSGLALGRIISYLGLQLTKLPIQPQSGQKFHSLPKTFEGWTTFRDEVMGAEAQAELGTENYVTRWLRSVPSKEDTEAKIRTVQFHAAYYTGMIDTVPHVPERCLIGGGMEYAGASQVFPVPLELSQLVPDQDYPELEGRGRILTARNSRIPTRVRLPFGVDGLSMMITPFRDQGGKQTLYAGYFFITNGGVVASANDVRLLAFKLRDDYAYYAKIQFLSADVSSAEELAAMAAEILNEIFPDIMMCVPDWIEVEEGRYPPDNPRRLEAEGAGGVTAK